MQLLDVDYSAQVCALPFPFLFLLVFVCLCSLSWQWLSCSWQSDAPTLNAKPSILCDAYYGGPWVAMMAAGVPALLIYQLGLPVLLCVTTANRAKDLREAALDMHSARTPSLKGAVILAYASVSLQYKPEWKVRWLFVEMAYKTSLVLCKVFLWNQLQAKCASVAALVVCYHALVVRCQPYAHGVMASADGALFFTFLASGASQIGITLAVAAFARTAEDAKEVDPSGCTLDSRPLFFWWSR